jgi:hypothetical protein
LSAYRDLMALARLCLRQASTARTPAAADELKRLAKEYEDRAAVLLEPETPASHPQAPLTVAQQQQQPQDDAEPAATASSIGSAGKSNDAGFWRERAEALRARAAQLTDGGGRLVMLQIAETYEALARRAERPGAAVEEDE